MCRAFFSIVFCLSLLLPLRSAQALPFTIPDNFIGGTPSNPAWAGQDIVGTSSEYSVSKFEVAITGGELSVSIFSSYFDNVGSDGTSMGDLFISTNGWSPFGPAPYINDTAANGETWEYALVFELPKGMKKNKATSLLGESGTAHLFQIPAYQPGGGALIQLSDADGGFRRDQEVSLNTAGLTAAASGSWSITNLAGDHDRLTTVIALSSLKGVSDSIGLHWTMSCGNDVIEGAAPITGAVPEPGTLLLCSSALLIRRLRRGC